MSFPNSVDTVTLTCGPVLDADGNPRAGVKLYAIPARHVFIAETKLRPGILSAATGADGTASLEVIATDSAGLCDITGTAVSSFRYRIGLDDISTASSEREVYLPKAHHTTAYEDLVANTAATTPTGLASTFVRKMPLVTTIPNTVTRTSNPEVMQVVGYDPTVAGRIFASNRTNGPFAMSNDYGATWDSGTIPTGVTGNTVQKMVRFGAHVYAKATETATGTVGIYRTDTQADPDNWSWSDVLVQLPTGASGIRNAFSAGTQYLYLGEYGSDLSGSGGPRIKRSANGTDWETVWGPDPDVRHVHSVIEDPYNPGHIYAALGDNSSASCILRSTNHGASGSWTTIISGANQNPWQCVQISFSPDWVWIASDRLGFTVAVFDRTDCTPMVAATNNPRNTAVPGAAVTTDRFYEMGYWGAVDPATGIYYHAQMDTSTSGNTFGIFTLNQVGGRLELLDHHKSGTAGYSIGEVFITGGKVYIGNHIINAWTPAT